MRKWLAPAVLAFPIVAVYGCAAANAQNQPKTDQEPVAPRELVVYNQDFALVSETRPVDLKEGLNQIALDGVSSQIDESSVVFDFSNTKDAEVTSSVYEAGVRDPNRALERFLGQEVDLVYKSEGGFPGQKQKAILLSAQGSSLVAKVGDKIVVYPNAYVEAPSLTSASILPRLSAGIQAKTAGKADLKFSYLTRGLSWSADYIATLAPDEDTLALECWAGVTNTTGTAFKDAKVTFVAGSPNRAVQPHRRGELEQDMGGFRSQWYATGRPSPTEAKVAPEPSGELYSYPYKPTASILPDQTTRVKMITSDKVKIKRDYAIALPTIGYDFSPYASKVKAPATLSISFKNTEADGLGLPLPAGAFRVYDTESSGKPVYLGAATQPDVAKNGSAYATLSNVFDVWAEPKIVKTVKSGRNTLDSTIEVTLRNEKAKDVLVRIVQPHYGMFKVLGESHKGGNVDSGTRQWKINVPKGKPVVLKAVVRTGW